MALSHNTSRAGFTLIELAVSMIIIGVLFASIAYPYSVWVQKTKYENTVANMEDMALIIAAFRSANGRYPCPAPLSVPRTDPSYGFETDCNDQTAVSVGSCADGICAAQSLRTLSGVDVNNDGTVDPVAEEGLSPRVRIGSIPFRSLNIAEESAHDGYGSKILYAVTEAQARDYPMNPDAGGISVQYEDPSGAVRSRLDPPDSADFTIISHGPDKIGSYRMSGAAYGLPCDETSPDGENCDHVNNNPDSIFFSTETATSTGSTRHDDMVLFQMPLNAPVWARSATNENDIFAIRTIGTDGKVGGDWRYNATPLDPADPARVWIGGNILVEGDAQVREFCNADNTGCFPARIIGGSGIQCTAGLMTGIAGADVVCSGGSISITCPGNSVLQSFSDGELVCGDFPCPETTVTSCSQSYVLPAMEDGSLHEFYSGDGGCNLQIYSCNSGTWINNVGGDFFCSCTPSVVPYSEPCGSNAYGTCTGQKDFESVTECGYPCLLYNRFVGGTCDCPAGPPCVAESTISSSPCEAGCLGTIDVVTTTTCDPANTSVQVINNCHSCPPPPPDTCTPSSTTVSDACTGGCAGTIDTTTTVTCSPENTSVSVVDNCHSCPPPCEETSVSTYQPCPPGCMGGIETIETTTCSPPGTSSTTINSCDCSPPPCTGGGGSGPCP